MTIIFGGKNSLILMRWELSYWGSYTATTTEVASSVLALFLSPYFERYMRPLRGSVKSAYTILLNMLLLSYSENLYHMDHDQLFIFFSLRKTISHIWCTYKNKDISSFTRNQQFFF